MFRYAGPALAAAVLTTAVGCGTSGAPTRAAVVPSSPATTSPSSPATSAAATGSAPAATPSPAVPHFATPEAAMRYLATAYNTGNEVDLRHVTTPDGRAALDGMRPEAVNLRLVKCTATGAGDYTCQFDHDFPASYHPSTPDPEGPPPDGSKAGWAEFTVAPATGPGWYMTVIQHCG